MAREPGTSQFRPGSMPMIERLTMVGVHQRDVPVALRERMAFGPDTIEGALTTLRSIAAEGFILSTCNRVEVYAVLAGDVAAERILHQFLASQSGLEVGVLAPHVSFRAGIDVARHLYRVAAGLDSMVLGEDQIMVQIKAALELATRNDTLGQVLHRLVDNALAAGKAVRTHTGIARSRMSVVSVALDLAQRLLGPLATRRVLVIGAGQSAELALKHLRDLPSIEVTIANRSLARAEALAARYGAAAQPFAQRAALLANADVVVCCTSSPEPVISSADVAAALAGRTHDLLLLDLAVPRDVDAGVALLPGATLYAVDDLQAISAANRALRAAEIEHAEALVEQAVERFDGWLHARQATPTIRALRDRAESIRVAEVERMLARMPELAESDRQAIHALSTAIVNKLLHQPIVALKEPAGDDLIGAAQRLFQIGESR